MITLGISEARSIFAELVDKVDNHFERLYITKNGKARAVLISSDEYESMVETLASYHDKETRKRNKELENTKKTDLLSLDQLKQQLS